MSTGAEVLPGRGEAKPGAWFLLPLAWCLWLLVSLVPSMLVAPHLAYLRPWLWPETAPSAAVAAAAFFLVAVWPFWPALAAGAEDNLKGFLGRSVAELMILVALAAPFMLVASAIGGQTLRPGPLAVAAAVPATLGLGLRLAATGFSPPAVRWLITAALLIAVGPIAASYAIVETLGGGLPRLLEASPVTAPVFLATAWWPATAGSWIVAVFLWPAVGLVLAAAGVWARSRRKRQPI